MELEENVLRAGFRLDRYELLCPIAQGGMASVWLAQMRGKRGFEKLFAIKTIKTDLIEDPTFQEMFLDEARIASGIQHPNVTQILDLGEQGNILFIVMEWVDGDALSTIRRLLSKRGAAIPLGIALRVVADACAGLHAAHELSDDANANLGIVHRDVSPHNILLSTGGAVKVIDFGVMKAKNRKSGETKDGIIKGKVRYMAPEQVHGKPVDRRADVWGMGVVLYELVTGELPFDGDTDVDVIRRLMSEEPPPRPPGAIPDVVERIIERSLVRERSARFATCALMARAVEAAIDDLELEATGEDVAEFLRAKVPELATKRRQIVQKAVDAARARDKAPASAQAAMVDDDAFAPTLLSGKPEMQGATPSAPAKRPLQLVTGHEDSKVTPKATLLVGETQRGGGMVWGLFVLIVAALGAAAWFVWPGEARLRQAFSSAPAETASAAPPPPSAVPSAPTPPPSAEPLVIELDAAAEAAPDAAPPAHSGKVRHTWPAPTPSYEHFYFDAASILAPKPPPETDGGENNPY